MSDCKKYARNTDRPLTNISICWGEGGGGVTDTTKEGDHWIHDVNLKSFMLINNNYLILLIQNMVLLLINNYLSLLFI